MSRKKLGEILVDENLISREQLELALAQSEGGRLGETLVKRGYVTPEKIAQAVARQFGLPYVTLRDLSFDPDAVRLLSGRTARRYEVVPVSRTGTKLRIATSDPLNVVAIDDIALITGMSLEMAVMSTTDIHRALARLYPDSGAASDSVETSTNADSNAVVRLVNHLILQALNERASDIHLDPLEQGIRVRFRIDGILQDITRLDREMTLPLVSRIKVLAGLDISERRLPQDGSIRFSENAEPVDLRISTMPTILGEKVVLRLLKSDNAKLSLSEIGLTHDTRTVVESMLKHSYGMVLVTGPTGSGKTTSLYSALSALHTLDKNIVTVEDPVEFRFAGINQVQVSPRIGLNFANVLRSLVRQDPDIIMVGEIRDSETADIAIRSALTGHFVLSSLHTNDAPSTVTRLVDMGIEPFLVASSLIGIIAQRLVRRLCPNCREEIVFPPGSGEVLALGLDATKSHHFYTHVGCEYCGGEGYKGRVGIFEILRVNEEMRELITARATTNELRKAARTAGTRSFREDGVLKARDGITTITEVLRVAYQEV